ncbi:hypothetical protein GW17_00010113 [Ensete ventricosum]|nr:hypothetical protein GW17_00010113 [Ensete ventricosum]
MVSMSLMRDNLKAGGGRPGTASTSIPAPTAPTVDSHSSSEVQEIPAEEATRRASEEGTGVLEVPSKRQAKDLVGQQKKSRTPRQKPKSVRELCSASPEVDD